MTHHPLWEAKVPQTVKIEGDPYGQEIDPDSIKVELDREETYVDEGEHRRESL